jgi:hypothetical protein
MRNMLLCGASAAALITGFAGSASAASMTVYATPNPTTTLGNASGISLDLPLFNSNLGTLTSVLVVANLKSDSSNSKVHGVYSWPSATSSSTTSIHPIVKTAATITGGPSQLAGPASLSVNTDGGQQLILGGISYMFAAVGTTTDTTTIGSPTSAWEEAGGGVDPLTLSLATTVEAPPYIAFNWPSGGPDFTYGLSVTYTYTAASSTPEPTTMMILGAGLLGLGVARRRRRS